MRPYRTPILAFVFRVLGALTLGLVVLGVIVGLTNERHAFGFADLVLIASFVAVGVLQLGVGEVIDLVARVAYHAERTAEILIHTEDRNHARGKQWQEFVTRIKDSTSAASRPFYYVDAQDKTHGPVTREVLRRLRTDGTLKDDTLVCMEGDATWRTLREHLAP